MIARFHKIRRAIADSPGFNLWVARRLAQYISWCHRTSRWQAEGLDEMMDVVRAGEPVIFVLWHQRLFMTPFLFDITQGPFSTLTSSGRSGRLAGQIFEQLGFDTVAMSSHKTHVALSREVLRRHGQGHSLGIAADGPQGPAHITSNTPLIWARTTGSRVFCVAFAQRRVMMLPTWDKLAIPLPWSEGALVAQEWVADVPKRASEAETEALKRDLEAHLDAATERADVLAGRPEPHVAER